MGGTFWPLSFPVELFLRQSLLRAPPSIGTVPMFLRISHSSTAFFFPYEAPSDAAFHSQAGQQLLEQAAERGIASTRDQENTLTNDTTSPPNLLHLQFVTQDSNRRISNEREKNLQSRQ